MKSINNQINKSIRRGQIVVVSCILADSHYNSVETLAAIINENGVITSVIEKSNGAALVRSASEDTKKDTLLRCINSFKSGSINVAKFNPNNPLDVVAAKVIFQLLQGGVFSESNVAYLMGYGDSDNERSLAAKQLWNHMVLGCDSRYYEESEGTIKIVYKGFAFEKKWGVISMGWCF